MAEIEKNKSMWGREGGDESLPTYLPIYQISKVNISKQNTWANRKRRGDVQREKHKNVRFEERMQKQMAKMMAMNRKRLGGCVTVLSDEEWGSELRSWDYELITKMKNDECMTIGR